MHHGRDNLKGMNVGVVLLGCLAFFSPWAGYTQLALGLTPATLPAILAILYVIFVKLATGKIKALNATDYSVSIIFVIAGLSYFWSLSVSFWLLQYFYYILCLLTFLVTLSIADRLTVWNYLLYFLFAGSIVAMLSVQPVENEWGVVLARQTIEGLNNNYISYILAGAVSLSLVYGYMNNSSRLAWLFICIFIGLVYYNLSLLGTRGAMISVVLLVCWALIYKLVNRRIVVGLALVSIFSLVFISFGVFDLLLSSFDMYDADRATGDLSGRLDVWPLARNLIYENLFLGIGIGAFSSYNPIGIGAHNFILTMLLELGLIGFILFSIVLIRGLMPGFYVDAPRISRYVTGSFICYWTPIALTGHWELAIPSWLIFALHCLAIKFNVGSK